MLFYDVSITITVKRPKTFMQAMRKHCEAQGINHEGMDMKELIKVWMEPLEHAPVEVPPGAEIDINDVRQVGQ